MDKYIPKHLKEVLNQASITTKVPLPNSLSKVDLIYVEFPTHETIVHLMLQYCIVETYAHEINRLDVRVKGR